ncbi:hypothetical protein BIY23_00815 [Wolbachia pipientis]|uniref:ATP synthase subunit b n=1 Tax=Wolbachia pipientis TaxID=955 RepID=A0A1E7QKT2_WOLPI|nr:hypothetical protein [Wolbachia pipientis]OEY87017.1 hypothetical protein BIY23_00815 [Wolbachia pipientis]
MSTSLIIAIAFFVGVILSCGLLKKMVGGTLRRKRRKNSILGCDEKEFKDKVLGFYKSALKDYDVLIKEVKEMEEALKEVYSGVVTENKEKLGKELNDGITANVKQAADQIIKAKEELEANIANIAANNVRMIMNKQKDSKRNSEIITTLSRDLSKKLH